MTVPKRLSPSPYYTIETLRRTHVIEDVSFSLTERHPGAPQLAGRHLLAASQGLVLGGHLGMDAGLSSSLRVFPGLSDIFFSPRIFEGI